MMNKNIYTVVVGRRFGTGSALEVVNYDNFKAAEQFVQEVADELDLDEEGVRASIRVFKNAALVTIATETARVKVSLVE